MLKKLNIINEIKCNRRFLNSDDNFIPHGNCDELALLSFLVAKCEKSD